MSGPLLSGYAIMASFIFSMYGEGTEKMEDCRGQLWPIWFKIPEHLGNLRKRMNPGTVGFSRLYLLILNSDKVFNSRNSV